MGIQAAAARRSIERDPARAAAALEVVEQSAHTAVEELRRLVHTLRTPEAEGASSTVGIAQLATLVSESQSAGVPTTLIVAGEPRPLPMLVDVALYRVVQEALTNVRKHAGRGASAEVRLRFEQQAVEVEVSDDGVRQRAGAPSEGSGLGLRGMRERIGAVGGTVQAGRREPGAGSEAGGFLVRAAVPNVGRSAVGSAVGNDFTSAEAAAQPVPETGSGAGGAGGRTGIDTSTSASASTSTSTSASASASASASTVPTPVAEGSEVRS